MLRERVVGGDDRECCVSIVVVWNGYKFCSECVVHFGRAWRFVGEIQCRDKECGNRA